MATAVVESAKQAAAYKAIDTHVKDKTVIGIGSGATVAYAVHRLAERVKDENLNVVCIAGSYTARQQIMNYNLVLGELETHPKLDCTFDGADEVDEELNVINGAGGYFALGKILASCSKELIIVADHTKTVKKFAGPFKRAVAIEVVPLANVPIRDKIQAKFGGRVELRIAPKTAKYGPVVTDSGNFILDWDFPDNIKDWETTNMEILLIPGVVETGIFIKLAAKAYFGMEDGSVKEQSRIQAV